MTVYLIVFAMVSVCAILSGTQVSAKWKDRMYWGCAGVLVLLSALRDYSVGADTLIYCEEFHTIRGLPFLEAMHFRWEQGYVAVNWLLGQFLEDERFLLILMSCIILFPIFIWIKRESQWPILSLVVFIGMGMWNASMFILRQWCAMAVLTFSYKYIRERKFVPFFITVLIAMLFHRTAAVFILVYFVAKVPLNRRTLLVAILLAVIEGVAGEGILSILNHFARISEAGNFNGGIKMLLVLWACVLAAFIFFKEKIPEKMDLWFRIVLLAALIQPIAFTFSNWARVVSYFSVALTIFLPDFIVEWTDERTDYLPSAIVKSADGKINHAALRMSCGIALCVLMLIWFKLTVTEPYAFMSF